MEPSLYLHWLWYYSTFLWYNQVNLNIVIFKKKEDRDNNIQSEINSLTTTYFEGSLILINP